MLSPKLEIHFQQKTSKLPQEQLLIARKHRINRRRFLKQSAALGAVSCLTTPPLPGAGPGDIDNFIETKMNWDHNDKSMTVKFVSIHNEVECKIYQISELFNTDL